MDNCTTLRKSKNLPVDKSCWSSLRIRFETLFIQYRKSRAELIHFLGYDKAKISRIVNGQEIPNVIDRNRIASFFVDEKGIPIDTSVIWENPDVVLIKNKEEQNEQ